MFLYKEIKPFFYMYNGTPLVVDGKFNVYINGIYYTTLFGTQEGIEYAIIGVLIKDGLININGDRSDILISVNIEYNPQIIDTLDVLKLVRRIDVSTESKLNVEDYSNMNSISLLQPRSEGISLDFKVNWEELMRLVSDFNVRTTSVMGLALHTSGLYDLKEGRAIIVHDTSRHTSILKVIGIGVKENISFRNSVVITTGRVSSDIIISITRAGIPIAISLRGPLFSGVMAARTLGVTLVANAKIDKVRRLLPLTHPERIEGYQLLLS